MSGRLKLLLSAISAAISFWSVTHAAEFEVLDKFSVNGYTEFRGSAAVSSGGFTVGGSTFAVKNGNVGIGTAGPVNKLEVDGGAASTRLRISTTHTGAQTAGIILANSSKTAFNDGIVMSHGSGYTRFDDLAGNEIMRLIPQSGAVGNTYFAGKVGIGTAGPGNPLSVIQGYTSTIAGLSVTGPTWSFLDINTSNVYAAARNWRLAGVYNSFERFEILSTPTTGGDGTYATRLSIDGITGNVGIGTTGPGAKLDVEGGYARIGYTGGPYLDLYHINGGTDLKYTRIGSLNGVMTFESVNDAYTAPSEHMRIDASGNVGIGTTGPGSKLQVKGADSVLLAQIAGAGQDYLQVYSGGTSPDYGVVDGGAVLNLGTRGGSPKYLSLSAEGGANLATMAGNVGIGTTGPEALFDVRGSASFTGVRFDLGTAAVSKIILANVASHIQEGYVLYDTNDNHMALGTYAQERVRINQNGNVGIGTTSPGEKLQVNGTVKASNFSGIVSSLVTISATATVGSISPGTWTTDTLCPTGYTIVFWGTTNSTQYWGSGMTHWYASCEQNGNGIRATLYTDKGYVGHSLVCSGLCAIQ